MFFKRLLPAIFTTCACNTVKYKEALVYASSCFQEKKKNQMNPDMSEPVSIHTEVPIWTDLNRGIIFMFCSVRAHAVTQGRVVVHKHSFTQIEWISTQIHAFLSAASAHRCRGSRMVNNSMRPPPQRWACSYNGARFSGGCHIAMLPSVAIVN